MTYQLCCEEPGFAGAARIERFGSEAEALTRARELLAENEHYTLSISDDAGEVACGVRLQLKLGFRVE